MYSLIKIIQNPQAVAAVATITAGRLINFSLFNKKCTLLLCKIPPSNNNLLRTLLKIRIYNSSSSKVIQPCSIRKLKINKINRCLMVPRLLLAVDLVIMKNSIFRGKLSILKILEKNLGKSSPSFKTILKTFKNKNLIHRQMLSPRPVTAEGEVANSYSRSIRS